MKAAIYATGAIAALLLLSVSVCWGLAIWTDETRWIDTAFLAFFSAFPFGLASFLGWTWVRES